MNHNSQLELTPTTLLDYQLHPAKWNRKSQRLLIGEKTGIARGQQSLLARYEDLPNPYSIYNVTPDVI